MAEKPKYEVRNEIDLGLTRTEHGETLRAVLVLETSKHYDGGVSSSATVFWCGKGSRSHAFGLGGPGDFSSRTVVDRNVRATRKNIDAQYARVFPPNRIEDLTAAAIEHYPVTTFYDRD